MSKFYDEYQIRVKADMEITKRMVANGELSEEEGWFRDDFRRDEILEEMEELEEEI